MYVNQVGIMDDSMRGLVSDYHEDGTFDSDINRGVDKIYEKDFGNVAQNVVSESRA